MNQIHIDYMRYPDDRVSGLSAQGLNDSQLRHYAMEAGFGVVGDPEISTVYIGSRRHIERLFVILELAGYEIAADEYEILGVGLVR